MCGAKEPAPPSAPWPPSPTPVADTGEDVTVTVTGDQYANARSSLDSRVRVVEAASWLGWARDIAPTFVVDDSGRRRGVDFAFNGYGNRYPYWATDDQYARKVLDLAATDRYRAPLVLEGGAFHVDGEGTALVTAETLLDPARNDSPSRTAMEELLASYLGITRTLWIEWGLSNDATRGHVDSMACFAAPSFEICLTWTDDTRDPQYDRSARALEELRDATDAQGRALRVEKLPLPGPLHASDDEIRGLDSHRPRRRTPNCPGSPPRTPTSTSPPTTSSPRCSTASATTRHSRASPGSSRTTPS